MDSLVTRFAVEAREAIQAHLAALFAETNLQQKPQEAAGEEALANPEPTPLPVALSELEREELDAELSTRHDWIKEEGRQQREVHGLYQRRSDQRISTTDPDATPMRLKSGGLQPSLSYPLCGRWRQTLHHSDGTGHPLRGHGQPAHARSA